MADPRLGEAYIHCDQLLREHDLDRWLACLFAPWAKRRYLHALYAFNLEVARVREIVSDPMPGEIRDQWWREALVGEARGQVYVPVEILAEAGSSRDEVIAGRMSEGLGRALARMRALARDHLAKALAGVSQVKPEARVAFLPLALVEAYLAAMERRGFDPFRTPVELPQWRRQWRLWRAARSW